MLRQAVSLHQALAKTAKAIVKKVSGRINPLQSVQPAAPAVQLLPIPLKNEQRRDSRPRCRYFSSTATRLSTRSSFQEDYDECHSHGLVRRALMDKEFFYSSDEPILEESSATSTSSSGFLLEELKRKEEEMPLDALLSNREQSGFNNNYYAVFDDIEEEDFAFVEGNDDFDLEFEDSSLVQDFHILDES